MAEESIPKDIMNGSPDIFELTNYVKTASWNKLGIQLKIDQVILAGCNDDASMYQKWLATKPSHETTRKNLIAALRAIKEIKVVENYIKYLTKVSLN